MDKVSVPFAIVVAVFAFFGGCALGAEVEREAACRYTMNRAATAADTLAVLRGFPSECQVHRGR